MVKQTGGLHLSSSSQKKFQKTSFYQKYQWDTDTAYLSRFQNYIDSNGYFAVFLDILLVLFIPDQRTD